MPTGIEVVVKYYEDEEKKWLAAIKGPTSKDHPPPPHVKTKPKK